jgi:hypothetical protein
MLREYLERGTGDNRGWAEDPSRETDAGEDGSTATTAATQAAVNALMPDTFRSGSNKAALNFEVASDKAPLQLHKFARIVADTWLSDYKMGNETDPTDANIYTRKVSTLAMMVSHSLSKIGYPSEHVSAAKVSALIKKMVKQSRWRMKNDRGVKTEGGTFDATNGTRSASLRPVGSISQRVDDDGDDDGQPRTNSIPRSRDDSDEDYRDHEDSIISGPSDNDSEEVAWSQRKSAYSAPASNKGRKTTAANRHDDYNEDEVPTTQRVSSSPAPVANKRQKTAAVSKDAMPTSSDSITTADTGSKKKLTAAASAAITTTRGKKTT